MRDHRLWYIKHGSHVSGPFPEALVASYLLLGRLHEDDQVSLNSLDWQPPRAFPELNDALSRLVSESDANADPSWREERHNAALRWLDDRKSPDPRRPDADSPDGVRHRRSGKERRQQVEGEEIKHYRQARAQFESWLRRPAGRQAQLRVGLAVLTVVLVLVAVLVPATKPLLVNLSMHAASCEDPPAPRVRWSQCVKDGVLLVGADLQGAELLGASLKAADLRYANLTSANLSQADLTGADITGARLANAIWPDGRVCAARSVGTCQSP